MVSLFSEIGELERRFDPGTPVDSSMTLDPTGCASIWFRGKAPAHLIVWLGFGENAPATLAEVGFQFLVRFLTRASRLIVVRSIDCETDGKSPAICAIYKISGLIVAEDGDEETDCSETISWHERLVRSCCGWQSVEERLPITSRP